MFINTKKNWIEPILWILFIPFGLMFIFSIIVVLNNLTE